MADDYTPTTEQVRNNMALGVALSAVATRDGIPELAEAARDVDWPYPGFRERTKGQFDSWLAAHVAEKRAEWEAEQGETEWEDRTPWRGLRTGIRRSDTLAAKEAEAHVWSPRTRSEVLPVPDTASESREERSPAEGTAPHWSIISADNIVIAQGYCWCADPNGGYHQIGIKPAPVPDTANTESARTVLVDNRDPECVKAWPGCHDLGYDPACCRFPKSCSAGGFEQVPDTTNHESEGT